LLLVLLEEVDAFGREGEAAGAGALERAPDAGGPAVEVEVFPMEAEEFASAESGAEGEFVPRSGPPEAQAQPDTPAQRTPGR
jgi:hypothetical protein